MSAPPELFPAALKMLAALAAVLGGLFAAVTLARRYFQRSGAVGGDPLVRVVASHFIGIKKAVTLVEIPGAVLVLGVAGDRIQLLDRIDDPETLGRIQRRGPRPAASFAEQLGRLTARRRGAAHEE
ncbi:MAG: flagellar biosynthetic protein FliO [Desulfobacterales bacterium]|jgi:flagellar biogenesis protein FliO|nr:flagellar biosynthetic protein FliO [Desulfobacterales bacterium]